MNVSAVLVEQLEPDGHLLTFQMRPEFTTSMTVALANEYAEPRVGPFHFLDPKDEQSFSEGFATGKVRKLSETRFKNEDGHYRFHTSWLGIPTARGELSYYALSLPEFAIPETVELSDPRSQRPYNKTVLKDEDRHRFVLYLECRSSHGTFDFQLDASFRIDKKEFENAANANKAAAPRTGARGSGADPQKLHHARRVAASERRASVPIESRAARGGGGRSVGC
jgi:hypothetical protein